MTESSGELSPARAGAEVLRELASARATGVLVWERAAGSVELHLSGGRPARARDAQGQTSEVRETVTVLVRAFACALGGSYRFERREVKVAAPPAIDTLGEVLVAVLTAMTEAQLTLVWQARTGTAVAPSPTFGALQAACRQIGAPAVQVPAGGERLVSIVLGAPLPAQRSVAALLFLGGLTTRPAAELAPPAPASVSFRAPTDPRTRAALSEIDTAYDTMQAQSFYEVLGVGKSATAEDVRRSYLALAKRWHADRFAGIDLGPAAAKVDEIFRRVGEAERILSDPEQRQAYDFVLERQAQGLPTDPVVILEAEAQFKKAQGLVRRGQAAAALPLLERAVELNKGEPEFWVYLGYALFCAKGMAASEEARGHIRHGLEARPNLDVGHEFLGRIARVEGDVDEARKHLRRAIELNRKNLDAERELRLITMRRGKTKAEPQSLGELLGKLFKR